MPSTPSPAGREGKARSVDEALDAGLHGSHPVTLHAKMLRLELLKGEGHLDRELGQLVLNCTELWPDRPLSQVMTLSGSPG